MSHCSGQPRHTENSLALYCLYPTTQKTVVLFCSTLLHTSRKQLSYVRTPPHANRKQLSSVRTLQCSNPATYQQKIVKLCFYPTTCQQKIVELCSYEHDLRTNLLWYKKQRPEVPIPLHRSQDFKGPQRPEILVLHILGTRCQNWFPVTRCAGTNTIRSGHLPPARARIFGRVAHNKFSRSKIMNKGKT